MLSTDNVAIILAAAHAEFPAYYAAASEKDTALMDRLVLCYTVVLAGYRRRRDKMSPTERHKFEKEADAAEAVFVEVRERVRRSAAFVGMPAADRRKLEEVVFEVRAAWLA